MQSPEEGDFNGAILSGENTSPSGSVMLRRVMNPRSALRFALGLGSIKGSSKNLSTYYQDFNTKRYTESAREPYEFKNTLVDFNALYEIRKKRLFSLESKEKLVSLHSLSI